MTKRTVGGMDALRYSLDVARQVGLGAFLRALHAGNTCKTCAFGTGGQKGGMHNEAGHFPEFCKKNLQSQLTDLQGAIPATFFERYSITELRTLGERGGLEHAGRLTTAVYKPADDDHYRPIDTETALARALSWLRETDPQRSFFYASGRSSNEAAFLLQLFARALGTNHINNCAYYCHQASGAALTGSIGSGAATVRLSDLKQSDLIVVIGANPASNHPRFIKELAACRRRGGEVIVINPAREPGLVNFTLPSDVRSMISGGSEIASVYLQINIGADIALLKGIAKACLERQWLDPAFIERYTVGFADYQEDIIRTDWARIERDTGLARAAMENAARLYSRARKVIFAWGLGVTQHLHGVDNVESIVNLALLRAMVGKEGAGLLPLRGHSNVQGVGSMGMTPALKAVVWRNIEEKLGLHPASSPHGQAGPGLDPVGCLAAAHDGAMDLAFLLGGNLFAASPDSHFTQRALARIPRKIHLSPTLNSGHVHGAEEGETLILPVTVRDEEKQATTQESMFSYVRVSEGGIHRFPQLLSEVEIIGRLASERIPTGILDFSVFRRHKNIRRAIAEIIPGFEAMAQADDKCADDERPDHKGREFHIAGRAFHRPHFPTETGKAHFRTVPLPERQSADPLALSIDPLAIHPPSTGNDTTTVPREIAKEINEENRRGQRYTMSSVRSEGQFNTIIYEHEDLHRGQRERRIVLMNGDDMRREGLRENDRVTLRNTTGSLTGLKVRRYDLPPGNLLSYFPEANVLIPNATDPRSKTPAYKSVAVTLKRE
uniref:Oxidoreductase alpha (Molybdopterin) subunit n=1 Tax=Candidatus Kentrum sp. FM TaxID=2126340 RepID=A0A450W2Q3_9GAMM|nr:MAG: oxidoreductase alpha (molybdopterin) subunit [Candidatus Kentron sp. FM]VFJ68212.1 MAG: oxidoreductase alpha (molybdopterin) subunit [Candidatus Kentron sp. FM]VFK11340.1 MAG: oxidoreductase alpha (molybdopterin) subunit [Candidatus Kentron sp. FM]